MDAVTRSDLANSSSSLFRCCDTALCGHANFTKSDAAQGSNPDYGQFDSVRSIIEQIKDPFSSRAMKP